MSDDGPIRDRAIDCRIEVPASIRAVWDAWTTEKGVMSFFAPQCRIDLRPGGAYEMLFNLAAEQGSQGGEGMVIMALQPPRMLAFTWNAPPHLPDVRGQRTQVIIRLEEVGDRRTLVYLRHGGWGTGGQWDEAFDYFSQAWADVVLPRLKRSFEHGPIEWGVPG